MCEVLNGGRMIRTFYFVNDFCQEGNGILMFLFHYAVRA